MIMEISQELTMKKLHSMVAIIIRLTIVGQLLQTDRGKDDLELRTSIGELMALASMDIVISKLTMRTIPENMRVTMQFLIDIMDEEVQKLEKIVPTKAKIAAELGTTPNEPNEGGLVN